MDKNKLLEDLRHTCYIDIFDFDEKLLIDPPVPLSTQDVVIGSMNDLEKAAYSYFFLLVGQIEQLLFDIRHSGISLSEDYASAMEELNQLGNDIGEAQEDLVEQALDLLVRHGHIYFFVNGLFASRFPDCAVDFRSGFVIVEHRDAPRADLSPAERLIMAQKDPLNN